MDIRQSVETLETLANGIDPVTGELIPTGSPYNKPEVIRALFTCVQHIKSPARHVKRTPEEKQADNLSKGLPRNAGLPWTDEVRSAMAGDFSSGHSPGELAGKYERSKGSIIAELKKQGLITEEQAKQL